MIAEVPIPLVREIRSRMRDYPEINYLYSGKESSDEDYARILWEAMEKVSASAPVLTDSWSFRSGFPRGLIPFLLDLSVAIALREVSLWMMRNDFQYQTGNTTVRLYDRWRAYQTIYQALMAEANNSIKEWKTAYNSERAWGMSLTEMFDGWRMLDSRDWVTVTV
jgi:hypothetical protein